MAAAQFLYCATWSMCSSPAVLNEGGDSPYGSAPSSRFCWHRLEQSGQKGFLGSTPKFLGQRTSRRVLPKILPAESHGRGCHPPDGAALTSTPPLLGSQARKRPHERKHMFSGLCMIIARWPPDRQGKFICSGNMTFLPNKGNILWNRRRKTATPSWIKSASSPPLRILKSKWSEEGKQGKNTDYSLQCENRHQVKRKSKEKTYSTEKKLVKIIAKAFKPNLW